MWTTNGSSTVYKDQIRYIDPSVACYTEIRSNFIPEGHSLEADTDYGYSDTEGKRKVVLWSR